MRGWRRSCRAPPLAYNTWWGYGVMAREREGKAALPAPGPSSRYGRDNGDLIGRLRRIEGQVRGIQRMLEEDRYCVDILMQLAAVRAAVTQVGRLLLDSHARGCVANAVRSGDGERAIDELLDVIHRFLPLGT